MSEVNRARMKVALRNHYASKREEAHPETIATLAQAMVAEDARVRPNSGRNTSLAAFVAAQVRFIPIWTWVAQIAVIALMHVFAAAAGSASAVKLIVGMLSALAVLVGIPALQASKLHNVAELEYACVHNAASIVVARMIILGCSSALAVAVMVCITAASLDTGVFAVALWAAPPYFLSCAGSLLALRKAAPANALAFCIAWVCVCCGALVVFAGTLPETYSNAALAVWLAAAALAAVWLVREVAYTFRAAAAGLDVFSPQIARTNN